MPRPLRGLVAVMAVAAVIPGCDGVAAPTQPSTSPGASPIGVPSASLGVPSASLSSSLLPTIPTATLAPTATTAATASPSPVATPVPTATASPLPVKTPRPTNSPTQHPTPRAGAFKEVAGPTGIDCNYGPMPAMVQIKWTIVRATGVTLSIDEGGLYDSYAGTSGTIDAPFACGDPGHVYVLETTGGVGAPDRAELHVERAKPLVQAFFGPTISSNGPCNQVFHVSLHYAVINATGASIQSNGQVLGTYNGQENDVMVDFDCRNTDSQKYTLTTLATYGPQDSMDTTLTYQQSQ